MNTLLCPRRLRSQFVAIAGAAICFGAIPRALGVDATVNTDGAASPGSVHLGAHYVVPAGGASYDTVYLGYTSLGTITQNSGTLTATTIAFAVFNTGRGIYNLNGGTLNVLQITIGGTGGNAAGNTLNFNGGTLNYAAHSSNTTLAVPNLHVFAGGALINTGGRRVTVQRALINGGGGGDGGLTKLGAGTLVLNSDNTYNGPTTVSAGTLQLGSGGSSGSVPGDVTVAGELAFNRSDNFTYANKFFGSGLVSKLGSGTLTLSGWNEDFLGATAVREGNLSITGMLAGSELLIGPGRTVLLASAYYNTVRAPVTIQPGGTLNAGQATENAHTFSVFNLDGGHITSSGTQSVSGWSSTTGAPATITTYGNYVLHDNATVTVTQTTATPSRISNSVVQLYGPVTFNVASAAQLTIAGDLNPLPNVTDAPPVLTDHLYVKGSYWHGGSLVKTGGGTLVLAGRNSYSGGTVVNAGTLQAAHPTALSSGPVTVGSGAALAGSGNVNVNGLLTVDSGGLVKLTGGTLTAAGGLMNNGVVRVTGGATLAVAGGSFTNNGVLDLITGSFSASHFINNGIVYDSTAVRATSIVHRGVGQPVTITIEAHPGHTYRLEKTAALTTPFDVAPNVPVQTVPENTNPSAPVALTFNDIANGEQGFYRVAVDP
jgi:fibronectin-binding autotransporter adhesin